jgi:hypothetical protein
MDQGVGRIVAELKQQWQLDRTLILYLPALGWGQGVRRFPAL